MFPLSFKEYAGSTGSESDLARKYTAYLENSSFSDALEFSGQTGEIRDYLEGVFNTIVVKDISQRKKITDPLMLKSILRFVFDNIGSPLSSKKIADTLTSNGRKIDPRTIEKYLDASTLSRELAPLQKIADHYPTPCPPLGTTINANFPSFSYSNAPPFTTVNDGVAISDLIDISGLRTVNLFRNDPWNPYR